MPYANISFFDLDHTLLKVNGSFQFGMYLYRTGLIPTPKMIVLLAQYALHKWNFISPEKLNNTACKNFFSGRCLQDIEIKVDSFLEKHFEDLLSLPIIKKLGEAHEKGHFTVILSTSPHFLVEPIAKRLGVNAWDSTRYAVNSSGDISHIESHMDGNSKALYVKSLCKELQVPIENTTAYSDSYYDLNFLKAAGVAKVVNPDRKLRNYSLENNWEIL